MPDINDYRGRIALLLMALNDAVDIIANLAKISNDETIMLNALNYIEKSTKLVNALRRELEAERNQ
jgi:hypothetical protein